MLAILAAVDASTYRTRYQQARNEADKGATQSADFQATAETLDKRLARAQVELAAAQAAVVREREIVVELNKTVTRLGEDLAKASRAEMPGLTTRPNAGAMSAIAAGGTFPSATLPIAGVPMNRREPTPTVPPCSARNNSPGPRAGRWTPTVSRWTPPVSRWTPAVSRWTPAVAPSALHQ